jgi:hypothetical protein
VIGVGRVPHPEKEAENQEGRDVQGGFGHCARAKMATLAVLCSVSTRRQFPYVRASRGTAAVQGRPSQGQTTIAVVVLENGEYSVRPVGSKAIHRHTV